MEVKAFNVMKFFFFFQEAALKTFHISDDPKNYYVSEASEFGKSRHIITCRVSARPVA